MTLVYKDSPSFRAPALPAERPASGRDRRVHHRRDAELVWAQVDGGWYKVHDLSLGGLGLDRPVEAPGIGSVLGGEIHSRAAGRPLRCDFEATVVRLDDGGARIGVAFTPMEADQIDGLLAIMSAVERDYVQQRQAAQRGDALRHRLRRLAIVGAAVIVAIAAGYAAWVMR